mgnify:CR=1 FL=1
MARDFNGTTQYLSRSAAAFSGWPVVGGAWIKGDSWATTPVIFSVDNSGNSPDIAEAYVTTGGKLGIYAERFGAAGAINFTGATTLSTGIWYYVSWVINSGASEMWVNGVSDATNSDSYTFPSVDTTRIGANRYNAVIGGCFDGLISELTLWNVAVGAADWLRIAKGLSAKQVLPANIVSHTRLMGRFSPEPDAFSDAWTLTNSPTQADHPRIIQPPLPTRRRRRLSRATTSPVTDKKYHLASDGATNMAYGFVSIPGPMKDDVRYTDSSVAIATFSAVNDYATLQLRWPSFRIPTTATITGLKYNIGLALSNYNMTDGDRLVVEVTKARLCVQNMVGTTDVLPTPYLLPADYGALSFSLEGGGNGELWGGTFLTPEYVAANGFGLDVEFKLAVDDDAQGQLVNIDYARMTLYFSTGISVDLTPVVIDFTGVAQTAAKAADVPATSLELAPIAPGSAKAFDLAPVVVELAPVAPTSDSATTLSPVVVEFVSVAATTAKTAAVPPAGVEFVGLTDEAQSVTLSPVVVELAAVSPGSAKAFDLAAVVVDLAPVAPTADKTTSAGPEAVDFAAIAPGTAKTFEITATALEITSPTPTTAKAVDSPAVIVDFFAIAPTVTRAANAAPVVVDFVAVVPGSAKAFTLSPVVVEFVGVEIVEFITITTAAFMYSLPDGLIVYSLDVSLPHYSLPDGLILYSLD